MGTYDTYGENIQIKAGGCMMKDYEIGDICDLADGIYLEYGGAIVILDGKFVAEFSYIFDKWGGALNCKNIIDDYNPCFQAIKNIITNTNEFWTVEYQYVGDDFYWASSGEIYDKERATSVYDELKNKYPVIKLVHNTRTQEVIKGINCTKG